MHILLSIVTSLRKIFEQCFFFAYLKWFMKSLRYLKQIFQIEIFSNKKTLRVRKNSKYFILINFEVKRNRSGLQIVVIS